LMLMGRVSSVNIMASLALSGVAASTFRRVDNSRGAPSGNAVHLSDRRKIIS
jgi:hypothetical protein